jgi:hypothetical protein
MKAQMESRGIYRVTDGSRTVFKKKKYSVDFQIEMDLFLQN